MYNSIESLIKDVFKSSTEDLFRQHPILNQLSNEDENTKLFLAFLLMCFHNDWVNSLDPIKDIDSIGNIPEDFLLSKEPLSSGYRNTLEKIPYLIKLNSRKNVNHISLNKGISYIILSSLFEKTYTSILERDINTTDEFLYFGSFFQLLYKELKWYPIYLDTIDNLLYKFWEKIYLIKIKNNSLCFPNIDNLLTEDVVGLKALTVLLTETYTSSSGIDVLSIGKLIGKNKEESEVISLILYWAISTALGTDMPVAELSKFPNFWEKYKFIIQVISSFVLDFIEIVNNNNEIFLYNRNYIDDLFVYQPKNTALIKKHVNDFLEKIVGDLYNEATEQGMKIVEKISSRLFDNTETSSSEEGQTEEEGGDDEEVFSSVNKKLFGNSEEEMEKNKKILEVKKPKFKLNDVILPKDLSQEINEIVFFIKNKDRLKEWGLLNNKYEKSDGVKIVFYGLSGTGKTLCAEAIAGELGYSICYVDASNILSKWVGESEKNAKILLQEYQTILKEKKGKVVLIIDEADQLFFKRTSASQSVDLLYNTIQNILLSGIETSNGVIIATTNLYENFDPAWERRFDYRIQFNMPDAATRELLWKTHTPKEMPIASDVDFKELSNFELTGAEIQKVIQRAARIAIMNDTDKVTSNHILEAINLVKKENEKRASVGFLR